MSLIPMLLRCFIFGMADMTEYYERVYPTLSDPIRPKTDVLPDRPGWILKMDFRVCRTPDELPCGEQLTFKGAASLSKAVVFQP